MISRWENSCFDRIGFTSGENFAHSFPNHFHAEYTIGVSVNGIQQFELQEKSYLVQPFSLFLIKPGQMHAHHPVADIGWSFKSLYLSPDFVDYLLKEFNLSATDSLSPVTADKVLYNDYLKLHDHKKQPREEEFAGFMEKLWKRSTTDNSNAVDAFLPGKMDDIKYYLSQQTGRKLNLDHLAKKFYIDKYQLIRQFKKHTGVTPNTYLTILRIEKAKKLINLNYPIVEAALDAGFYDQSHFHHSFLYYTGVTPGKFTGRNR